MSYTILDLTQEWQSRQKRESRATLLWMYGLVGAWFCLGLMVLWAIRAMPQAQQAKDHWKQKAERALAAPADETEGSSALSYELLMRTRARNLEFDLSIQAFTRLLPRDVWLEETNLAQSEEEGLAITLRGSAQQLESLKTYTDRLRKIGLFSEVTPLSVNRESDDAPCQFDLRLTLPNEGIILLDAGDEPPPSGGNP